MRLASTLLLLAAPAAAQERYLGVFLGSQHVGSDEFNDVNPGLTYGLRRPYGERGAEWQAEAGVFYNSYEEVSPIALVGLATAPVTYGVGEVRLGATIGVAYYGQEARRLEEEYGVPYVFGLVPLGILSAAYRTESVEWRLNVIPYGEEVDGVVNLSLAVPLR